MRTSERSRYATAESLLYVAQASAAGCVLLFFGPALLNLFGLLNARDADGWSEVAALSLGIPSLVAFGFVAILSLVMWARGPDDVRSRLVIWYIVGPSLFIAALLLDPERMNAYSPGYDSLAAASLVSACVLPIVWLRSPAT